ncbi:MAG: hypothetical protein DLM50_06915 [Candidatus Meridianibacter frigidus]|nr:MAG: hypothetical protein DLM50_06915 [Candidatus Eremiobacteraeota bacterium]
MLCAILLLTAGCGSGNAGDPFVDAVRKMRPSVVLITMQVPGARKGQWDDGYATGVVVSSGSWGTDILTVAHAVEGERHLQVIIENARRVPGRVTAKNGSLDLAMVRASGARLLPAQVGDSAALQAGQTVGIIGYPIPDAFEEEGLGLAASINSGRVSSFRKHALELNLPIVPGESGAPVFTDDGALVGIAESRFDEERSIGFALPINEAKDFLRSHAHP